MAVAFSDEIEDLITCSVCLVEYDHKNRAPKFLQCYHTVCLHCLQSLFFDLSIICPLCRSRSSCLKGPSFLKTNYYSLQLAELNEKVLLSRSRSDYWCVTCSSLAKGDCFGKHLTFSIPSRKESDAHQLQKDLEDCKAKISSAVDKHYSEQRISQGLLRNFKSVQDGITEEQDRNHARLDHLLQAGENLVKMTGLPETYDSLRKRIDKQNVETLKEMEFLAKLQSEREAEDAIKVRILLETADKQKITTVSLFEDGYNAIETNSKEMMLLRHLLFSTLRKKFFLSLKPASQLPKTSTINPAPKASEVPPTKKSYPEASNVIPAKTAKLPTSTDPPIHAFSGYIRVSSPTVSLPYYHTENNFVLTFRENNILLGQVHIKPYVGFNQMFMNELGAFVGNSRTFHASISSANPKMFLKMDFRNEQFRPCVPSTWSRTTSAEPYDVGLCRFTQDNGKVVSWEMIFLLKTFMERNMEISQLFGEVVIGHSVINELSCKRSKQRKAISVVWNKG